MLLIRTPGLSTERRLLRLDAEVGQPGPRLIAAKSLGTRRDSTISRDRVVLAPGQFLHAAEIHREVLVEEVAGLERRLSAPERVDGLGVVLLGLPGVAETHLGQAPECRRGTSGGHLEGDA